MKVTICGPNLPRRLSDKGTLHAHAEGCADLRKYPNAPDSGGWTIEATSILDVVVDCYPPDNFLYDETDEGEYQGYRSDVYVAPCVKLPERPEGA